ncbi:MAG: glycosyltransferase family 4 protein [Cyanobacteria bacterium K_DeepCast_35m_m2_023]|nr:glycosyltransferase family 4 protein [Cyanobacteria bacterium K_DeepCast_35m_m2_023]
MTSFLKVTDPAVTHDKVVSIARSADVGMCLIEDISLSDYYCLPNKLFEYCFAGIPVLASDFPDICSVVTDYKLGLVTSLEIDKLKKAVKEFEKNIIDVSFNICDLQPLCWDEQAKKLLGLYHDVLN